MPKHILIMGATGVAKSAALVNVLEYLKQTESVAPSIEVLHFEADFVRPLVGDEFHDYLDALDPAQQDYWNTAWTKLVERLQKTPSSADVIICLHGILARPIYGIRSPVYIPRLIDDFKPTSVFTLIDDVYSMWLRTEKRAHGVNEAGNPTSGYDYVGRPSLEQLLAARRAELLLADVMARNCLPKSSVRNYVVAINHPARTLARLVIGRHDLRPVYLSFPISGPRRLLSEHGDRAGIDEVNSFLRTATEFERLNAKIVFFCPLTIDELALTSLKVCGKPKKHIRFPLSLRWNVRDFYGPDERLLCDSKEHPMPGVINLVTKQVQDALPCLGADLATRDYRLVLQSKRLAIFNPWFKDKETAGVRNEITCAQFHGIPSHIYQDPKHDRKNRARAELRPRAGSLGPKPGSELVIFHKSIEELFKALLDP